MNVKKDNFIRLTIIKTEKAISKRSIRLLKIHPNIWILFSREQYSYGWIQPCNNYIQEYLNIYCYY